MTVFRHRYFSDYCLYGVEPASEFDMNIVRQPNPRVDPADRMGEKWFYEKKDGDIVRYRMRMTEDQRQLCVGDNLSNRAIADDCEGSAHFLMQVMKSMRGLYIRVKQVLIPALIDILKIPKPRQQSARFVMTISTTDPNIRKVAESENADLRNLLDEVVPTNLFPSPWTQKDRLELLLAFTNIMSQFDFDLALTVGTANAAGVGKEEHLCGHCYAILTAKHKATQGVQKCIMEGTNWVFQERKAEQLVSMCAEDYQMYNQIGALLMELTKIPSVPLIEDLGKALVHMVEGRENTFYRTIMACGNKIQMLAKGKPGEGKNAVQFGVSAGDIVEGNARVFEMPVNYTLVTEHLKRDAQQTIDPFELTSRVHKIGYEATVPAWQKAKWDKVLFRFFSPCKEYYKNNVKFNASTHVRIVFTHELYRKMEESDVEKFQQMILGVLRDGKPPQITAMHSEMVKKPFHAMGSMGERIMQRNKVTLHVDAANEGLNGIQDLVQVETIFTAMQSLVTVCVIRRSDLKNLHSKLSQWGKLISAAHMGRHKVVDQWIVENVLKNGTRMSHGPE